MLTIFSPKSRPTNLKINTQTWTSATTAPLHWARPPPPPPPHHTLSSEHSNLKILFNQRSVEFRNLFLKALQTFRNSILCCRRDIKTPLRYNWAFYNTLLSHISKFIDFHVYFCFLLIRIKSLTPINTDKSLTVKNSI